MGKISVSINENVSKNVKLKAFCKDCDNETNHIVLQSIDTSGNEIIDYHENSPVTIDWEDKYQIIQCQGCDTISFRHLNWFSENHEYFSQIDNSDGTTTFLYPKRSKNSLVEKDFYNVPHNLRRIYKELIDCFNNESYTLCAAGLRATIEGICANESIIDGHVEVIKPDGSKCVKRKNTLEGKIGGLFEKNILSENSSKILHEHRFLGNEAVHELLEPSVNELKLAIEIIEHTLESLYEIPEKAASLKAKRISRKKS